MNQRCCAPCGATIGRKWQKKKPHRNKWLCNRHKLSEKIAKFDLADEMSDATFAYFVMSACRTEASAARY